MISEVDCEEWQQEQNGFGGQKSNTKSASSSDRFFVSSRDRSCVCESLLPCYACDVQPVGTELTSFRAVTILMAWLSKACRKLYE